VSPGPLPNRLLDKSVGNHGVPLRFPNAPMFISSDIEAVRARKYLPPGPSSVRSPEEIGVRDTKRHWRT
jgi:hypothetical protein